MSCFTRCACCAGCRPRYQRLVDNIYPANPTDGLVTGNMQKLTFYAISHPEKLDRIGEYLAKRLGHDVYRERIYLVKVSVEAMDRLLAACHGSPSLNLFVESFLKMVQRLLETASTELQLLATDSFVNFSNIQEDTPSYHRRYDFFISRFSELCHSSVANLETRRRLRVAGLKGLRGVVRKTVSDDLQANIWEQPHMDKIVPSLLFNMHDEFAITVPDVTDNSEEFIPKSLADACLRELTGKASYGNMKSVLLPLLSHFDMHKLWTHDFAVVCFKLIMFSIQSQYSYVVIQALMSHLDKHMQAGSKVRNGMATVLSEIVVIGASASIGPSLLEIFNNLLRHLRYSVERGQGAISEEERRYQETLINTMGEFANNLPDYQKVEIMMFIIGKIPLNAREKRSDSILQNVLVKTLLKVATKYRTGHLAIAMPVTFLDQLLQLALVDDRNVRLLVQKILHTLLDRHDNLEKLEHLEYVSDVSVLKLNVEKCSRADSMFIKKNGGNITLALYRSNQRPNNDKENYDAILCTMTLLCIEVGSDDALVELFRLALGLQTFATSTEGEELTLGQRAAILNLVALYFNIAAQLMAIPALVQHVESVLKTRSDIMPALNVFLEGGPMMARLGEDVTLCPGCAFDKDVIALALQSAGHDTSRLNMPFATRSTVDSLRGMRSPGEDVSVGLGSADVDSIDFVSTDYATRRPSQRDLLPDDMTDAPAAKPITFEMLKEIANTPPEKFREEETANALRIAEMYRTLSYQELLKRNRDQSHDMSAALSRILQKAKDKEPLYRRDEATRPKTAHEIEFPDLFVY